MDTLKQLLIEVVIFLLFAEFGRSLVTDMQWAQYKAKYRKHYKLDDNYHRAIYNRRVQIVANHNRLYAQGKVGFRMGLNELALLLRLLLPTNLGQPVHQDLEHGLSKDGQAGEEADERHVHHG